jgi:hypothetical protein
VAEEIMIEMIVAFLLWLQTYLDDQKSKKKDRPEDDKPKDDRPKA